MNDLCEHSNETHAKQSDTQRTRARFPLPSTTISRRGSRGLIDIEDDDRLFGHRETFRLGCPVPPAGYAWDNPALAHEQSVWPPRPSRTPSDQIAVLIPLGGQSKSSVRSSGGRPCVWCSYQSGPASSVCRPGSSWPAPCGRGVSKLANRRSSPRSTSRTGPLPRCWPTASGSARPVTLAGHPGVLVLSGRHSRVSARRSSRRST